MSEKHIIIICPECLENLKYIMNNLDSEKHNLIITVYKEDHYFFKIIDDTTKKTVLEKRL